MILLLSQDCWEVTTEDVQDWVQFFGGDCLRVNGDDLNGLELLSLQVSPHGRSFRFVVAEREINSEEVTVVWSRRWHTYTKLLR